jgi:anti-sigma B factor antagonist
MRPQFAYDVVGLDGRVTVHLLGEIDVTAYEELRPALTAELQNQQAEEIVVDLADVTFFDASALRMVLQLQRSARQKNRDFWLVRVPERVQRVIDVSGVGPLLPQRVA